MKLKLPNLGTLVNSDKTLESNDLSQLIHVIKGHAVVSDRITAIVNLREYVKIECSIKDEIELDYLTDIIDWMEGKSFTKKFWDEIKAVNFVSLIDGGLQIQNVSYTNQLIWENTYTDTIEVFDQLHKNILNPAKNVATIAFKGENLSLLHKAFGSEIKSDSWLFDFSGNEKSMRFSGKSKHYIFGYIPLIHDDANELTAFMSAKEFATYIKSIL